MNEKIDLEKLTEAANEARRRVSSFSKEEKSELLREAMCRGLGAQKSELIRRIRRAFDSE